VHRLSRIYRVKIGLNHTHYIRKTNNNTILLFMMFAITSVYKKIQTKITAVCCIINCGVSVYIRILLLLFPFPWKYGKSIEIPITIQKGLPKSVKRRYSIICSQQFVRIQLATCREHIVSSVVFVSVITSTYTILLYVISVIMHWDISV